MIKPDELYNITIMPRNIEHFKKWYPEIKCEENIQVTGEQTSPHTRQMIKYICDFCGKEFVRVKDSNQRSFNTDACPECRQQKIKNTCLQKYGVNSPMQVEEIHSRSVKNHHNNFRNGKSNIDFINGIPASKVQKKLGENLKNFVINYFEEGYYYDLFNAEKNLVIEYNGRGHDLILRLGSVDRDTFNNREEKRIQQILNKHNLLIISDSHDRLIHPKRFNIALTDICQAVEENNKYKIISIE